MRFALLELLIPSVCPGCDTARREGEPLLCPKCRRALAPLHSLRGIRTALAYERMGARLIQRFKFDGRRDALRVLLPTLVERARGLNAEGIVPVPRHLTRVRELGSDPVYELGRALARELGRPLWAGCLRRSRATQPQTGLGPRERRANVAGSFSARPRGLQGRRVLLVDDVTTTGATLREAAKVLRRDTRVRWVIPLALAGTPNLASGSPPGP